MHAACESALGCFVYNYQTLIAGLIAVVAAIGAALYAARPVWRQLAAMSIQTNTGLRDFLQDRIRIISVRRKWFADRFVSFGNEVSSAINRAETFEGGDVNPHWAFDQDQKVSTLLDDVRRFREERRDPPAIDTGLEEVITRLELLQGTFHTIHRTSSMAQSDQDYAISDEEWAGMEAAIPQAEKDLSEVASAFAEAVKRLDGAFSDELKSLRERVRQVDLLLMRS
jgi:hypothetical protein